MGRTEQTSRGSSPVTAGGNGEQTNYPQYSIYPSRAGTHEVCVVCSVCMAIMCGVAVAVASHSSPRRSVSACWDKKEASKSVGEEGREGGKNKEGEGEKRNAKVV